MPDPAIFFEEQLVGAVAEQRVAEHEHALIGGASFFEHLIGRQNAEHAVYGRDVVAREHRRDAFRRGRLAEDARRFDDPLRLGPERVETRLHGGEHRVGELERRVLVARRARRGDGTDELFQIERIAIRAREDAFEQWRGDRIADHAAHQRLARFPGELGERESLRVAGLEQPRKAHLHLGSRHCDHEQRLAREISESTVDEADRRRVGPVNVLEDDRHRPSSGEGAEPVFESGANAVDVLFARR